MILSLYNEVVVGSFQKSDGAKEIRERECGNSVFFLAHQDCRMGTEMAALCSLQARKDCDMTVRKC